MTTLHYHRLYQISSLEANLSLQDIKQFCVDRSHIHTGIPPTPPSPPPPKKKKATNN